MGLHIKLIALLLVCFNNAGAQQNNWLIYHEKPQIFNVQSLEMAENGNSYFCGVLDPCYSNNPRLGNNYVACYDTLGQLIFQHQFNGYLELNHVKGYTDTSYLVSGVVRGGLQFDNLIYSKPSAFCLHVSHSGNLLWSFADTSITQNHNSRIAIANQNRILVSMGNQDVPNINVGKIIELDANGNLVHEELFFNAAASDIDVDSYGNLYLSCEGFYIDSLFFDSLIAPTSSYFNVMMKYLVVKYDTNLNAQWLFQSPGHDGDYHPGIMVVGNNVYWYRMETSSQGAVKQKVLTSINSSSGIEINEVVVGPGDLNVDFFTPWDISGGNCVVQVIVRNGDSFLQTYDLQLNIIDTIRFNITASLSGNGNKTVLAGMLTWNKNLNFSNGLTLQGPPPPTDTSIIALIKRPVNIGFEKVEAYENNVEIYPNPVDDSFSLEFNSNVLVLKCEIYSLEGELLFLTENVEKVDVSRFKPGIYLAKVFSDKGFITKKLVKI